MKKKILSMTLALCLVLGSASALPQGTFTGGMGITASADSVIEFTVGDIRYRTEDNKTAYVYQYVGMGGDISVPRTIRGLTVTKIGDYAFDLLDDAKKIKKVTLPDSITEIGTYAFFCSGVTEINLPDSVTKLGEGALAEIDIKSITLPKSLTSLPEYAFSNCVNLEQITIPGNIKTIGARAFGRCSHLEKVVLSEGVQRMDKEAFYPCEKLSQVTLPNTLKSIGIGAFKGTRITSINIPNGVADIGSDAFMGSVFLEKVTIGSGITSIGSDAFSCCIKLKTATIAGKLTELSAKLFSNCYSLENVTIPTTVKKIVESAFEQCNLLSSVTLPNGLTEIGKKAFYKCPSLKTITVPDSVTNMGEMAMGFTNDYRTNYVPTPAEYFRMIYSGSTAARNYAESNNVNYAHRLAGSNRYATAAEISKNTFDSAGTVVIASGESYADALAGVPYAKSIGAPILLTEKNTLPAETLAEIKGIGAKKAIILGGTGAVSDNVKATLEKNGITVERLSGGSRYSTATKIAPKVNAAPTDVFFVVGTGYADALSVSSVAAIKKAPIIYLAKDGEMDSDTAAYLAQLKTKGCIKNAYVIGGTGAISDDMLRKASNALGVNAVRIYGADRYSTCIAINDKFSSLFVKGTACLATGLNFPDALAGGVFAARKLAPLVLTSPNETKAQQKYFNSNPAKAIYVFGGNGVVSDKTIREITC